MSAYRRGDAFDGPATPSVQDGVLEAVRLALFSAERRRQGDGTRTRDLRRDRLPGCPTQRYVAQHFGVTNPGYNAKRRLPGAACDRAGCQEVANGGRPRSIWELLTALARGRANRLVSLTATSPKGGHDASRCATYSWRSSFR
jgi:hypothetical protein